MSYAMSKVTIPREVAEAIEGLRSRHPDYKDDSHFIESHAEIRANPDDCSWGDYPILNEVSTEVFARAVLNGYEIEKSPEEKLREYYDWYVAKHEMAKLNGGQFQGYRRDELYRGKVAIESTLDILGITIVGIND